MAYKINEQASYWEIEAEKTVSVQDCCYDAAMDTFVIAVKYDGGSDYVVINREHEIVRVVPEEQGMNQDFVFAPDKSVWICMSALCTDKEGEIVLPLYARERVEKEIVKSDIGIDYSFFWNGCHWGYVTDIFGDRPDKLLQYQFDKKGIYKTRKTYKLEALRQARPFVQGDDLYFCQLNFDKGILQIFMMTEPGKAEKICAPLAIEKYKWCRLVNVQEDVFQIVGGAGKEVNIITADRQGKILEEKLLCRLEVPEFYSVCDFMVSENGVIAFCYASENLSGVIEITDSAAKELLWQKDNVLYSKDAEIKTENKFAFSIMSDGRKFYYIAANIDVRSGKSRKIYVFEITQ